FSRALATSPADRFATALEFVNALREAFAATDAVIGSAARAAATRVEYTREAGRLSATDAAEAKKDEAAAIPADQGARTKDQEPKTSERLASDPEAMPPLPVKPEVDAVPALKPQLDAANAAAVRSDESDAGPAGAGARAPAGDLELRKRAESDDLPL